MAIASASWASGDSAPSDMPALSKRARIAAAGSTSASGTGGACGVSASRSRKVDGGRSFTRRANWR